MDIAPYHPSLLLSILNYVSMVIFFVETPTIDFHQTSPLPTEYDYIIVGAGSAGCVLANRLSADNKTTVLLLEAGGPEEASARVPYFTPLLQFTRMDWKYRTEPQQNASYGLPGRVNDMPRGKTLGGTSSMNYMVYSRGNNYDYDSWEQKYGAENWSYRHVEQAFKDIETSYLDNLTEFRGHEGEVPVSFPSDTTKASMLFMDAGKELGFSNGDYNGANASSFSRVQRNAKDGERWSSSRAFLNDSVRCRPNLYISLHSHVTRVLFDGKAAVGVEYVHKNVTKNATARREVILSAGAIGSPQLLMLSGIGPKDDLECLNISVIENLPVGQNMYDHLLVFGIVGIERCGSAEPSLLDKIKQYALNRTGPLSYPSGVDSVAFVNTSRSNRSNPDLQLFLVTPYPKPLQFPYCPNNSQEPCTTVAHGILRRQFLFSIAPILLRPSSRGFIKLKSNDPFDPPIIDPQLLSNITDFNTMVEASLWWTPAAQVGQATSHVASIKPPEKQKRPGVAKNASGQDPRGLASGYSGIWMHGLHHSGHKSPCSVE
ncbi:alcohol dehydrogenase [acceptor]-like [Haemaphysalis longicornis]